MHRLAIVLVAGCRLHFDDLPADAPEEAGRPVFQLACNTPVKVADAPNAPLLATAVIGTRVLASWIDAGGNAVGQNIDFVTPDSVMTAAFARPNSTGFSAVATGATAGEIVVAFTQNGNSFVQLLDSNDQSLSTAMQTPVAVLGPRAVAATGAASGPIAAVSGNSMQTSQGAIAQVLADGTLGTSIAIAAAYQSSVLVNVGDRIAFVGSTMANNCAVSTIDLAVTARAAAAGWGTAGQCSQATLGYSPGRSDALLVRHDAIDGDLNHTIATRNGNGYTIPGENRLRNPGNEARPIGVADGYWVSYETGGTLEAAHVDFAGVVGTVVPLGPLGSTTAHGTVVQGGEPYVVWLQDGLELAHLCP